MLEEEAGHFAPGAGPFWVGVGAAGLTIDAFQTLAVEHTVA